MMSRNTIIVLVLSLGSSRSIRSQGVYIGAQANNPEASAVLELENDTEGVLIPRMTLAEMLAINNPAEGLMVYYTSSERFFYYNGTKWINFDEENLYPEVGDSYGGGIVFYVNGGSGYIAGIEDLDNGGDFTVDWGYEGTTTGATSATDAHNFFSWDGMLSTLNKNPDFGFRVRPKREF